MDTMPPHELKCASSSLNLRLIPSTAKSSLPRVKIRGAPHRPCPRSPTMTEPDANASEVIQLPTEMWIEICTYVEKQKDLAALATVSKGLLPVAEERLYKNVVVHSPTALIQFGYTISNHANRATLVHSLTLEWSSRKVVKVSRHVANADVFVAVLQVLEYSGGSLKHLNVGVTTADMKPFSKYTFEHALREKWVDLPCSLRTLDASTNILRRIMTPLPPLTALNLRVNSSELNDIVPYINRFSDTLQSLRLHRWIPLPRRGDSPARVYGALDTMPKLEYLEVYDEGTDPTYLRRSRYDAICGDNMYREALKEAPGLHHLVWAPTWGDKEENLIPGGCHHATVKGFRDDLFKALKLKELTLVLAERRCFHFKASDVVPQYTPVSMCVTKNAWRRF